MTKIKNITFALETQPEKPGKGKLVDKTRLTNFHRGNIQVGLLKVNN